MTEPSTVTMRILWWIVGSASAGVIGLGTLWCNSVYSEVAALRADAITKTERVSKLEVQVNDSNRRLSNIEDKLDQIILMVKK